MKKPELKKLTPLRSGLVPWRHDEALPPERPGRKKSLGMPMVFTFALVDLIVEDVKLSKGKARKVILGGKVKVNGEVTRDPDLRVDADDKVEYFA